MRDSLAMVILDKLRSGALPHAEPAKDWVGFGSGAACDECDRTACDRRSSTSS